MSLWYNLSDAYGSILVDNTTSYLYVTRGGYHSSYTININDKQNINRISGKSFGLIMDNDNNLYVSSINQVEKSLDQYIYKYTTQDGIPDQSSKINLFKNLNYYPTSLATDGINIYAISNNDSYYSCFGGGSHTTKVFQFNINNPTNIIDWPSDINARHPYRLLLNNNIMYIINYDKTITKVNMNNNSYDTYSLDWCVPNVIWMIQGITINGDYLYGVYFGYDNYTHICKISLSDGAMINTKVYTINNLNPVDICYFTNYFYVLFNNAIYKIDLTQTVCYMKGTLILTDKGFVPIEKIQVSDKVITKGKIYNCKFIKKNTKLRVEPVIWISKFQVAHTDLDKNSRPICIKKNAFGEHLPFQDLYVSPKHCLLLNGNIVFAYQLINGNTIYQDIECSSVEYYHLECKTHCAIFANGILAESYLDTNNRYVFETP
jgi:hypothetical protein